MLFSQCAGMALGIASKLLSFLVAKEKKTGKTYLRLQSKRKAGDEEGSLELLRDFIFFLLALTFLVCHVFHAFF